MDRKNTKTAPAPISHARKRRVEIVFNDEEYAVLAAAATKARLPLGTWLRSVALDKAESKEYLGPTFADLANYRADQLGRTRKIRESK